MKVKIASGDNKTIVLVFLLALFARYAFAYFSGIGNFSGPDWQRYNLASDAILSGNFNLEMQLFIIAPLFSYLVAALKLVFGSNYVPVLEALQIVLSSISVVYLMRTSQNIFKSSRVALLTGIAYSIYPITLYFTHQFSQESVFQSLFVISVFYFSEFLSYERMKSIAIFAMFFSLALLTKSHIILIVPFFILGLFIKRGVNKQSLMAAAAVAGIIFLITMPYGVYNKVVNGTYVVASSGLGGFFVTGHNDDFYNYVINPPSLGSSEHERLKSMKFEVYDRLESEVTGLNHQQKQARYLQEGLRWSMDNPGKIMELAWFNLKSHISPGFNRDHYPFKAWLFALMLSAPVFLLAYFEIARRLILDFRSHLIIVSIFLGMLCFALGFYSQNRFRVITIEPYYLMYACSGLVFLIEFFRKRFQRTRD